MQKIMSFNVRVPVHHDGENYWGNRKEYVAEIITEYSDGIVGLQEMKQLQFEDLASLLPGTYEWIGEKRDLGDLAEYNPIYFDTEKYQLLDKGQKWISDTPDVMSRLEGAAYNRIVTWGKFLNKKTNKNFYLFNVHFDYINLEVIERSAKILLNIVNSVADSSEKNVFVIGDLNCTSSSEAYKILAKEFQDTKYSARITRGPQITFTNWGKGEEPESLIDYIFTRNIKRVESYEVLDIFINGKHPSDHFPIVAEVEVE